jgi:hypothetical protein
MCNVATAIVLFPLARRSNESLALDGYIWQRTRQHLEMAEASGCKRTVYIKGHQNIEAGNFGDAFFVEDLMEIMDLI